MKYTEFLKLNEIAAAKGTTVKKYMLNEAEPPDTGQNTDQNTGELKTEKGNIFTRWGIMKKKLNAQGKKVQTGVIEKVIKQYLPAVLEGERAIAQQIVNAKKDGGRTDEEILQLVNKNLEGAKVKRQKQLDLIDNTTDQYIKNAQGMMNKKIDASKMNDKNKLNMKNYWLLLLTQIRMNAYAQMSKLISEDVKKIFGEDEESLKIYEQIQNDLNILQQKQTDLQKTVEEQKQKIQELERQLQTPTDSSTNIDPSTNINPPQPNQGQPGQGQPTA
jgi:hypothetical protein